MPAHTYCMQETGEMCRINAVVGKWFYSAERITSHSVIWWFPNGGFTRYERKRKVFLLHKILPQRFGVFFLKYGRFLPRQTSKKHWNKRNTCLTELPTTHGHVPIKDHKLKSLWSNGMSSSIWYLQIFFCILSTWHHQRYAELAIRSSCLQYTNGYEDSCYWIAVILRKT